MLPVRWHDLTVGKPLSQSIYDAEGHLLLAAGFVIETQGQLDALVLNGHTRDGKEWDGRRLADNARKQLPSSEPVEREVDQPASNTKPALMEDVDWRIGETFFLQEEGSQVRHAVKLIGCIKQVSVLVMAPQINGNYVFIRDGQNFVVRAFAGKSAYAFSASVVKSLHAPHPYLHLSYPKEIACAVVRRGTRIPVSLISSISVGGADHRAATILSDVSLGGAACTLKEQIGVPGQACKLAFKVNLDGNGLLLNPDAILRSITPVENGSGYRCGFEFVELPATEKMALAAFLHQTMVEKD